MPPPWAGIPIRRVGSPVGAVEHVFDGKKIAQGGHVAGYGAIAEGNENARALADAANFAQMIFIGDGAFDERDIDVVRELLDVGDGGVHEIGETGQIDQALIEIEKGHVAAGAAAQPGGGEARAC